MFDADTFLDYLNTAKEQSLYPQPFVIEKKNTKDNDFNRSRG